MQELVTASVTWCGRKKNTLEKLNENPINQSVPLLGHQQECFLGFWSLQCYLATRAGSIRSFTVKIHC